MTQPIDYQCLKFDAPLHFPYPLPRTQSSIPTHEKNIPPCMSRGGILRVGPCPVVGLHPRKRSRLLLGQPARKPRLLRTGLHRRGPSLLRTPGDLLPAADGLHAALPANAPGLSANYRLPIRTRHRAGVAPLQFALVKPMKKLLAALLLIPMPLQAENIIAVLKSPSVVERRDSKTGAFKGSISVNNAIDVGCDGETIAVLLASGSVYRYAASNGSFKGSIAVSGKPSAVQVSGGVIVVTTGKSVNRYNASSGAFMGSSSR
jgi:hypothetical protein